MFVVYFCLSIVFIFFYHFNTFGFVSPLFPWAPTLLIAAGKYFLNRYTNDTGRKGTRHVQAFNFELAKMRGFIVLREVNTPLPQPLDVSEGDIGL